MGYGVTSEGLVAFNTGPGLPLGVEGWTMDFLPHSGERESGGGGRWMRGGGGGKAAPPRPPASTPQGGEWQLEAAVCKPAGTGQAACLLFPGPSLVGRTQKYCITQPKHSSPRLSPFIKGNKTRRYMLSWPQARSSSIFSAELLSQGRVQPPGKQEPFFHSPFRWCWWWAFSHHHLPPRGPGFSSTSLEG